MQKNTLRMKLLKFGEEERVHSRKFEPSYQVIIFPMVSFVSILPKDFIFFFQLWTP